MTTQPNPIRLDLNNPADREALHQILANDPAFHGFRKTLHKLRVDAAQGQQNKTA
jgi:hypothetical protein